MLNDSAGGPNFLNRTLWIDDNLRVLRGINSECVDLIYLDPPFNTKRVYGDPITEQHGQGAHRMAHTEAVGAAGANHRSVV